MIVCRIGERVNRVKRKSQCFAQFGWSRLCNADLLRYTARLVNDSLVDELLSESRAGFEPTTSALSQHLLVRGRCERQSCCAYS